MAARGKPISTGALAQQLMADVLRFEWPADQVIAHFFKRHPQLGARDRAAMADGIWARLRDEPEPEWILQAWQQELGQAQALACAQAMRTPAPLDLRVNSLLCTVDQALASLAHDGVQARPSGVVPHAISVSGKPALAKTQAFQKGWVEVQDLGSQLLARCVAPKRGQFLVDFCAGAGGKTLALGAALKNTGRIYALDVSAVRLARLKPRVARSGLSNVWPTVISSFQDDRVKRLYRKADAVLVDAPCSGLGTLRRNPDLKWRMNPARVEELVGQQGDILHAAARLVKPGGRLVYGTCSPLSAENSGVVNGFLKEHAEFRRIPVAELLASQGLVLPASWNAHTPDGDLLLWPHLTGTDGFYAAVMERSAV